MHDTDTGGGAVTGNVIVDGESNNIFDDISTLDRVYGAVHLRKTFPGVKTQTVDKYYGSHVIISKLPGDEKIGVNLFKSGDWFDRRPAAQSRVENYLAQGGIYNGFLWSTQYQGSRSVIIFQSESAPVPGIGDVLMLVSSTATQYIRITRLDEELQTFTINGSTFTRNILTLEISDVLESDFVGAEISANDNLSPNAKIYNTVVANAARYYSARPLVNPGAPGDIAIKADSVYSQVVPSAQSETPILDTNAAGAAVPVIESAQADASFTISNTLSANSSLFLGGAAVPGTISINVSGDTLSDSGGQLKTSGGTAVATLSYSDGVITFADTSPSYSGSKTVTFRPAAAPQRLADTASVAVTAANRGYVWVTNIYPAPKPGSVRIAFRALNKWYELADNGTGGLTAVDSSIGSGTINYVTGSVSITLGALPDANTEIIFSWGSQFEYINRSNLTPPPFKITHQLDHTGIQPDSLVITWNDGTPRTANSDMAGIITGDATGALNVGTGAVELIPNTLPPQNTEFFFDYSHGALQSATITTFSVSGNDATIALGQTNITPGSVTIDWTREVTPAEEFATTGPITGSRVLKDNGAGQLLDIADNALVGTIDYVTGIATITATIEITYPYYQVT